MNVLVIAPHPDDEVLGCGGTIARHAENGDEVMVCIVTKGCEPLFSLESVKKVRSECQKADSCLGVKKTIFLDFPAAMLEEAPRHELNDAIVKVVQNFRPGIVYIPHRGDMQLDHKLVADASMVALRPKYEHRVKRILAYETMSETGWDVPNCANQFVPAAYNDISGFLERKLEALRIYTTQLLQFPDSRSIEAVSALAAYRGSMVRMRAAEAFEVIRDIWD